MKNTFPGFTAANPLTGPAGYFRATRLLAPAADSVRPADGGGVCDCGGAPFGCSVKVNRCEAGFMPNCTNNVFACSCQCMPR
jgi:hypothetical protein